MIEPLVEGDLRGIEEYLFCNPGEYVMAPCFLFSLKLDHPEQLRSDNVICWDCAQLVCFHNQKHADEQEQSFRSVEYPDGKWVR